MVSIEDLLLISSGAIAHPLAVTGRRDEIRRRVGTDIATIHQDLTPSVLDAFLTRPNVFLP